MKNHVKSVEAELHKNESYRNVIQYSVDGIVKSISFTEYRELIATFEGYRLSLEQMSKDPEFMQMFFLN
jgi:hypothetical protein